MEDTKKVITNRNYKVKHKSCCGLQYYIILNQLKFAINGIHNNTLMYSLSSARRKLAHFLKF